MDDSEKNAADLEGTTDESSENLARKEGDSTPPESDSKKSASPSDRDATQSLTAEAQAGFEDLNAQRRLRLESLKNGRGKSGITGDFDKPDIVDTEELTRAAEAIHEALDGINDEDAVFAILKDKSEAEREVLKQIYKEKYEISLEQELRDQLSGADEDKALNLLARKDESAGDAARIHTALIERGQWVEGRSDENCEKDIRDTLATMSKEQIDDLEDEYRIKYGVSLRVALKNDDNLSDASKKAVDVYLKGTDQRTDDDTLELIDIALQEENLEMFQEALRTATPEARQKFLHPTDPDVEKGEKRIKEAFEGHWYNAAKYLGIQLLLFSATDSVGRVTDADLENAQEYARHGKLSTDGKLKSNQSWFGDNEKAIDQAIKEMSLQERKSYVDGRKLTEKLPQETREAISDLSNQELASYLENDNRLTQQQKDDLKFYTRLKAELEDAGNETEIAKWEDQIAVKGGSLISKLISHRGSVYDDGAQDILTTVEDMSESDWKRLKNDPDYRKDLKVALETFLSGDELSRVTRLIDDKAGADSYDVCRSKRRSLEKAIDDGAHWHGDDEDTIYSAIKNMTADECKRYKDEPDFRKRIRDRVESALDKGPEQDAAFRMLDQVEKTGKRPAEDIVSKLLTHAGRGDTDESEVLRDIARSFKASEDDGEKPSLRQRINNPRSDEDKKFAQDFKKALSSALEDDGVHKKWAEMLLKDGILPADVLMALSRSASGDDEQSAYQDLSALGALANKYPKSEDEAGADAYSRARTQGNEKVDPADIQAARAKAREEIRAFEKRVAEGDPDAQAIKAAKQEQDKVLSDKQHRDKALEFLSADERAVALNALKQGEMRPEDLIRSHMLGAGTGEGEIKEALRNLTPEQLKQVKRDFARKYGEDLQYALLDELGGQDAVDASRLVRQQPTDARQSFNDARDDYYRTRDGIGADWVDAVWDGTGYMADEALNDFSRKLKNLTPEQQKELVEALQANLDMHRESKSAAADIVVDAVIIAASIAGAKFTGGLSLTLISCTALGGAAFKVLTKSALTGADYDWTSSQVVLDALTGAIDAAAVVAGPGQLAVSLKVGEKAAATAAQVIVREATEIAGRTLVREAAGEVTEQAAKALLKEGSEQALEKSLKRAVAKAIADGERQLDDKIIKQIAREVAADGQHEAVEKLIKKGLEESFEKEARSALKRTAAELALDMGSGAMADGLSGTVDGFAQWDNTKSFEQNMAVVGQTIAASLAVGAVAGFGGNMGFKAVGAGYSLTKSAVAGIHEHFKVKPGEKLSSRQLDQVAKSTGIPGAKALQDADGHIIIEAGQAKYDKNGDLLLDLGKQEHIVRPGTEIELGRGDIGGDPDDLKTVSRKHLTVGRDYTGRLYIIDRSSHGTFIETDYSPHKDQRSYRKVEPGEKIFLEPGDVIHLGVLDGPRIAIPINPVVLDLKRKLAEVTAAREKLQFVEDALENLKQPGESPGLTLLDQMARRKILPEQLIGADSWPPELERALADFRKTGKLPPSELRQLRNFLRDYRDALKNESDEAHAAYRDAMREANKHFQESLSAAEAAKTAKQSGDGSLARTGQDSAADAPRDVKVGSEAPAGDRQPPNSTSVKTSIQADGSTVTEFPSGAKITSYKDGTEITDFPSGAKLTVKPDGTVIDRLPDGRQRVSNLNDDRAAAAAVEPSATQADGPQAAVNDGPIKPIVTDGKPGQGTTVTVDPITNLTTITTYGADGKPALELVKDAQGRTEFIVDHRTGIRTEMEYWGGSNRSELTGRRKLDRQDRVIQVFDALRGDGGTTTNIEFGPNGKMSKAIELDGKGRVLKTEEYDYDSNAQVTTITVRDGNGHIVETRDPRERPADWREGRNPLLEFDDTPANDAAPGHAAGERPPAAGADKMAKQADGAAARDAVGNAATDPRRPADFVVLETNARRRPIKEYDPASGETIDWEYGPDGTVSKMTVTDISGRPVRTFDGTTNLRSEYGRGPDGQVTEVTITDLQGRVIRKEPPPPLPTVDAQPPRIPDRTNTQRLVHERNVDDVGESWVLARREVKRGSEGRIVSTKNIFGEVTEFGYGSGGLGTDLVWVRFPDKSVAYQVRPGQWSIAAPGKANSVWEGRITVYSNGTVEKVPKSGDHELVHLNGLREIFLGSNKYTKVVKDRYDRILNTISRPSEGQMTAFEYLDGGESPTSIYEYENFKLKEERDLRTGETRRYSYSMGGKVVTVVVTDADGKKIDEYTYDGWK